MPWNNLPATFSRKSIENIYGTQFIDGNRVTLLWKDRDLFPVIFESIRKAREIICLEFYIFRNDDSHILPDVVEFDKKL